MGEPRLAVAYRDPLVKEKDKSPASPPVQPLLVRLTPPLTVM